MRQRRIVASYIYKDVVFDLFRGALSFEMHDGQSLRSLPMDAAITGFFHDYTRDALGIYLESREFEPIPEGQVIPIWDLIIYVPTTTKGHFIENDDGTIG